MIHVINVLKLSGLGGVQTQNISFFRYLNQKQKSINHSILAVQGYEDHFIDLINFRISWLKLILKAHDKKTIIHSQNTLTSKRYLKLWKFIRPRNLILHEHGNIWNVPGTDKTVLASSKMAKFVIANSAATAFMLEQKFKIPPGKIKILHNGVLSNDAEISNRDSVGNSKVVIGYLGRLERFKGVHLLISAYKILPPQIKSQTIVQIIGSGPEEDSLKALAEGEQNIQFLGKRSDAHQLLRNIDIIVAPSIREPLGNSIIEAGFLKKAVIATNIDGICEIIVSSKDGILINPSQEPKDFKGLPQVVYYPFEKKIGPPKEVSPLDLAFHLERLIIDQNLRTELGESLHQKVKNKFSLQTYENKLNCIYSEAVNFEV